MIQRLTENWLVDWSLVTGKGNTMPPRDPNDDDDDEDEDDEDQHEEPAVIRSRRSNRGPAPLCGHARGGPMPAERAPMRKVREVMRLCHALGVSEQQIAITIGISRSTVGEYLRRAAVIGITWPVPEGMDDGELERRLFTPPSFDEKPARPLPDWTHVHRELKRHAVTLLLLWEEYRAEHADGYGYSRFCDFYREWCETISPTMRQAHGPAEKLFVDFAGDTVPVFDAATAA